jgi:hypothetical protein
MPEFGDVVELSDQRFRYLTGIVLNHGVGELPATAVASVPSGEDRSREPFGSCSVLSAQCTESFAAPAVAIASAVRNREERARIPARGELTEDTASDPEMPFDHEVHQVVREPGVIPRSGRHVQDRASAAIGRDRVAPFSGPGEGDLHESNDPELLPQGRGPIRRSASPPELGAPSAAADRMVRGC